MSVMRTFLAKVKSGGQRREGSVTTVAMGRERMFDAYDVGKDTFVVERGIALHMSERPSVLVAAKSRLRRRGGGFVFTITTGNHSVAAFPLLDGRFWRISRIPASLRGDTLMHGILCANVVNDVLEVSQRDVPTDVLVACDSWLTGKAGLPLRNVQMLERNDATLDHYRRLGQEWRIKPLAWTENEMRTALAASKKRISTALGYYHSVKGVHFLSFSEFRRFSLLAQTDQEAFVKGLRELVGVYEGNLTSFTRMAKHRGHHEIEFFGMKRGVAIDTVIPEIERLMEAIALGKVGQLGIIQKAQEIVSLYESCLARPEFADESSKAFVESMYMHVTGEVYSVVSEGSTPAFDDRRTALPGGAFEGGRLVVHPGADSRTVLLLENLCEMLSQGEYIEYANVYELRDDSERPLGKGRTREVVYKTNIRPLEASLVEKALSSGKAGYGAYMLARVGALRALGVNLSGYYKLLRRRPGSGRGKDFYVRYRCEGEPMESIPASYFRRADGSLAEEREVVLGLATLMGDAAAQNMAMKKFDPATQSPLYGVGKEIYEFEYDIIREMVVPKKVATCSIRGSLGWPDLEYSDRNLSAIASFYFTHFAHTLKEFQRKHTVPMEALAERFMNGFEFRTHAMEWQLSVMRDKFEDFRPPVPSAYDFENKWKFAMWSLERQERRLPIFKKMFFEKVAIVESASRGDAEPGCGNDTEQT